MAGLSLIAGVAAPLPIENLDTDQIMPKQFLLGIDKSGLAAGLLYDLRCHANGEPRPEFILNQPAYASARILVGGANFGCGSSREHAVWGLMQWGIAAVLAPSFGEIFYYNAMNNRLLALVLPAASIQSIMAQVSQAESNGLSIDIERGVVRTARGDEFKFNMSERQRRMILDGLDVLGMTLTLSGQIESFERRHAASNPWLPSLSP